MFKKIMSLMLAVMMIMSVAVMATSAAQVEIADNSADAIAEVAADGAADTGADAGADTSAAQTISFEVNTAGWNNFKTVFCHVWAYDGSGEWPGWQSKKEKCTYDEATGIATYDLSKTGNTFEPGVLYACIFSNDTGMQTYNLLMGVECIGDTAYCDGTTYENPEDSTKTALAAFWRGQDPAAFGPVKVITSIGNVVGTCVPSTTSAQAMFVDFLVNKLLSAQTHSGKNDQQLLDDTAAALDLKQDNVTDAIYTAGVTVAWKAEDSSLPTGVNEDGFKDESGNVIDGGDIEGTKPGQGSVTEKPESADKVESNTSGDSSNGGSSSTGSTSSNKTGSGSTTKTGQETTVLFVMVAIMMAAAGVVVISRKRENA